MNDRSEFEAWWTKLEANDGSETIELLKDAAWLGWQAASSRSNFYHNALRASVSNN